MQATQARDVSLEELEQQFGLQLSTESKFFKELQNSSPSTSDFERQYLKRVQQNYNNLSTRKSFSEEAVKMVVLSPLLDLAGLYRAPFSLRTEESIELISEDEGQSVKGKIDVLVVLQKLWALVIESKSTQFDVLFPLAQGLTYLLSASDSPEPIYGLLVNGREFVFLELIRQPTPTYARSFALAIERDDDLEKVLSILKAIKQKILVSQA
ncbi:MAG: type I restriction endonuclease subunit R [Cyanobacteria bacterium P01_D01_bin.36]